MADMSYDGNSEEDQVQNRKREKEEVAALKRKYANTTDPAKRAELAVRLAGLGHDPNKDSKLGNPVPERQSPPKATVAEAGPDMDPNKATAEARGIKVGASKHQPIGLADTDKRPGDQEMKNHETGEWKVTAIGEQHFHNFDEDGDPEADVDAKPVKDEAKDASKDARKDKAEKATTDSDAKADKEPAAKPVPKTSDVKEREASTGEAKEGPKPPEKASHPGPAENLPRPKVKADSAAKPAAKSSDTKTDVAKSDADDSKPAEPKKMEIKLSGGKSEDQKINLTETPKKENN